MAFFGCVCMMVAKEINQWADDIEASGLKSNSDVLRAYDIWLKTGSDRVRRQLIRNGIQPLSVNPSAVH